MVSTFEKPQLLFFGLLGTEIDSAIHRNIPEHIFSWTPRSKEALSALSSIIQRGREKKLLVKCSLQRSYKGGRGQGILTERRVTLELGVIGFKVVIPGQ